MPKHTQKMRVHRRFDFFLTAQRENDTMMVFSSRQAIAPSEVASFRGRIFYSPTQVRSSGRRPAGQRADRSRTRPPIRPRAPRRSRRRRGRISRGDLLSSVLHRATAGRRGSLPLSCCTACLLTLWTAPRFDALCGPSLLAVLPIDARPRCAVSFLRSCAAVSAPVGARRRAWWAAQELNLRGASRVSRRLPVVHSARVPADIFFSPPRVGTPLL